MKLFVILLSVLSLTSLTSSQAQCWTNAPEVCAGEDFCVQSCPQNYSQCVASVRVDHFGTVHVLGSGFHCSNRPEEEECRDSQCVMNTHVETHTCCCTGQLCNSVSGLTPSGGNPPTVTLPTSMPTGTPPEVPEAHLVCEYFNCSGRNQSCYHGYLSCSDDPQAELTPNTDHHYCVATYKLDETTNLHKLYFKGCADPQLATHCTPGVCQVQYTEGDTILDCCCSQQLCNVNVTFSDPEQFERSFLDPCKLAGCDACLITQAGDTICFCQKGYAIDGQNCIDIDECAMNIHNCDPPATCLNTIGSSMCECPLGFKLSEDGSGCVNTGLICLNKKCDSKTCTEPSWEYCDDIPNQGRQHCQTTFIIVNNTLFPRIYSCFNVEEEDTCTYGACVPRRVDGTDVFFCCCDGNLCNANISISLPEPSTAVLPSAVPHTAPLSRHPTTATISALLPSSSSAMLMPTATDSPQRVVKADSRGVITLSVVASIAVVLFAFIVIVVVMCVIYYKQKWASGYLYPSRGEMEDGDSSLSQPFGLQLRLQERIGRGQFGTVWKSRMGSESSTDIVATKVFSTEPRHSESFERELSIYLTPQLQHRNILRFITSEKRDNELYLIFTYHSSGSLYDLLKRQDITLSQFSKLACGAAAGVAHLHSEAVQNGKCVKPPIAHRDLKSKNVLVMSDFDCCISDLGLAVSLNPSGAADIHGQVGTARYMAPEVLEGAIYFQREAFQRIDVYSLSLVLWEMSSRTKFLSVPIEGYQPPFEQWGASVNPNIEEMKNIVVAEHRRPLIPKGFLLNSFTDEIVDTITEAWDEDAEGRLSASCIEERIRMFRNKLRTLESSKLSMELSPQSPTSSSGSTTSPTKTSGHTNSSPQQALNWSIQVGALGSSPRAHRYSTNYLEQPQHHHPLNETTV